MKKTMLLFASAVLLLGSCGTYTGQGAYVGGTFGAVLGSAVGGISGGRHGSDVGTIVGMAGGAVLGGVVGAAADQKEAEKYEQYRQQRYQRTAGINQRASQSADDSGYDASGGGDDRIDFDAPGPSGYSAAAPRTFAPSTGAGLPGYSVNFNELIEIRNARFIDADHDGIIRRGEECQVTFEIMNRSSVTLYDVQPTVFDTTGNKHIHISPNLHIESIAPNSGVRYTATILADRKLRDGTAIIRVAVAQGNHEITSQVKEFTLQTRKR